MLCVRQDSYWKVGGHVTILMPDTSEARVSPWPGSFEEWFRTPQRCVPLVLLEPDNQQDVLESGFDEAYYRSIPEGSAVNLTSLYAPEHSTACRDPWALSGGPPIHMIEQDEY